jgi:GDP-4-dehydro-6-deoxy-D-mannose reductase
MNTHATLVTGGAGFAGQHLLELLQHTPRQGPLLAWSRHRRTITDDVEWHQVDITRKAAVDDAIRQTRPAQIIHLAGSPHVGQSWRNSFSPLQTNVLGTHHLLEAVRRHRPDCRVLVVTSAMVYRESPLPHDEDSPQIPSSPYGLSKLAQDQLALHAALHDGLDVIIARPFNHAGPGQDANFAISGFSRQIAMIEAGLMPPEIRVGNLDAERDLTDVRDVAGAYQRLVERGVAGRAYNICSGQAHRIGDLLNQLIALARVPVTRAVDPDRLRPSDLPRLVGDCRRLRADVGWAPTRTIGGTLADTLEWWRSEAAAGRLTV